MSREDAPGAPGTGGGPAMGGGAPPPSVELLQQQAMALYRGGRLADAFRACRQILAARPDRADVLGFAGMLALKLGDDAEAARLYRAAVARRPGYAEAHYNLGNALKKLGRAKEALQAYGRAAQLRPELAPAHHNLGSVLQAEGRLDEAAEAYQRVLALVPEAAETLRNLGIVRQTQGRLDEALESYRRALRAAPGWPRAYNNLATVLLERGDAKGAAAACDDWLAANPGSTEALAFKCVALNELGDKRGLGFLLDFDRFVLSERQAAPPGYASLAAFNQALAAHVLGHPTLKLPPEDDPTYHHPALHITDELLVEPKGPMADLERLILAAIEDYRQAITAGPPHPFAENWPARWRLASWAVVLEGEGNLVPHIHLDGYLGGAYYPQLPETMKSAAGKGDQSGWFELGRPPTELPATAAPEVRAIRPEEGLMLLFPSYFYHCTLPFKSDERRITIAFDLVPED